MFRPLHNRILVLLDESELKKVGRVMGILVPDSADKEQPITGVVVVGNTSVKAGDRILFSLFGLDELTLEGKPHAVVSDSGILGVFE